MQILDSVACLGELPDEVLHDADLLRFVDQMGSRWWAHEPHVPSRRQGLPHTESQVPSTGDVWRVVKHMVTGSIADVPVPVHMCLPIDELQRRAEELEFSELLDQAARKPKGSIERMLLVAAFAQSAFQAVGKLKCMIPIMGETYELVLPEKRMRLLAETTYLSIKELKAIISWVAEGEDWRLEGEDEPSIKFHATSVELDLNWLDRLAFSDGDIYSWKKMTTGAPCISIISGLTPIFRGTIVVHNTEFQQSITLEFRHSSAWKSLAHRNVVRNGMFGYLEKNGRMMDRPILTGSWADKIVAHMPDDTQWTVFEVNPLPDGPNRLGLNVFSMQLNEMTPGMEARLPPTDTRRRRDLRALEKGDYAESAAALWVLEKRWRTRLSGHTQESSMTSLTPTWFSLRQPDGLLGPRASLPRYRYNGGYWEARDKGDWSSIPLDVQQCIVP